MKEAWNIHSHSATFHSPPSPSNASSAKSSTRTSLRPPIFNPYDRFTQPEFDAWIGDITSSIKRALRHDVEPEVEHPSGRSGSWKTLPDLGGNLTAEKRAQSSIFTEPREEESFFEDSFAHVVSRKAKGKARDPREGPGLGLKDQPIELLSDSEEEEVIDSLEEHAILSEDSEDLYDGDWEDTGSGLAESGKGNRTRPAASVHDSASFPKEDFGHEQEVADYSDADAPEYGEENDLGLPEDTGSFCEDDIGIDSGTEGFPMQRCGGDKSGSEDEFLHLSQNAVPINVKLVGPWDGPRTFAENHSSRGDQLAPSLIPNHLAPIARSPVSSFATDLQLKPTTDANVGSRPVSPSLSSTSSSPKSRETVDVAAINNPQDELEAECYQHLDAGDITVHAVESAAYKGIESPEITSLNEATPARKKDLMSGSDQRHDIILVPFSDDDHTDADGEDDEGRFMAIPPLGTSDLDIGDDWRATDHHQSDNDMSDEDEEDEIQEVVPTQAANDVAALTLAQFPEVVNTEHIGGSKVAIADPSTPTLAPTFQLTDPESFGDLPMSSPPSETPSPAAGDAEGSQQASMEQLLAVLEREIYEGRNHTTKPSSVAQGSGAESTDNATYPELEKFLLELTSTENATGIANLAPREDIASHEAFSVRHSEYVVEENWPETEVLSVDDSDDARSMPPLDISEVVGSIQQYEVEEPETDGRLTEVGVIRPYAFVSDEPQAPEIAIQVFNEDASITATQIQLTASSPESVTTPILEYPELPVDAPRSVVTLESEPLSAAVTIPAPIVADPSVPDPVPGSSPASTAPDDSSFAPRLSIGPSLKASDPEPSQISTGISGLFTPAQRSGDGTPVLLEYETAEAPRAPDESNIVVLAISTPPADDRPPSVKSLTAVKEDGGSAGDEDLINPTLKTSEPLSANANMLAAAVEDVNVKEPNPHSVDTDDDISSTPRGGSVEPAASPLFTGDTPGASLTYADRPEAMASGGERLHQVTDIAEGDEDADGEADPDYPQEVAAEAEAAVGTKAASNEVGNDIHNCEEILPHPQNLPARSLLRIEPQAIRQSSSSHALTLLDNSSALGNGVPDGSAVSDVKSTGEGEEPTQTYKRKRRYPNPGSARITRSKSGANAGGGEKRARTSSSKRGTSKKSKLEQVDASVTSADEDASEVASVSSGASAVYRLLHPSSRAGSVNSSASGDAPWAAPTSSKVVPLIHSHGLLLHHHGRPVPPPLAAHAGPPKDLRSDHAKAKSPTSPSEPSTPSLRRSQSINSPVTRSNCRFHKISLPQGESGQRAHFVVPGCALGDGELMEDEEIKDEGLSSHEDHKRMLPSVETLDLDPYLLGVLRKLVGVDLLREQQEIFYLPGEKEKPRKRRQTDAVETLRQLRRQSGPSSGPLARDHSPHLAEDWQARSTPPPSGSGSASRSHSEEMDSDLSDLSDNSEQPAKRHKRISELVLLENASADRTLDGAPATLERDAQEEKEQTPSGRPTTRSKRKSLHPDAAAYKPSKDENENEDEVVDTRRRKGGTRKATKRSRTMEDASASAPRPKKSRLGKSVSVAGAGVVDP